MRNIVIAECYRIAELLGEFLDKNLNSLSNKELLQLYGDLRVDLELEIDEEE